MTSQSIGQHYLEDVLNTFRDYKKLAEGAIAQTSDEDFFRAPDPESNSIAIVVKHLAGNMLSRWTDFLNTDGEKPSRNRDQEFVMSPETSRAEMLEYWNKGWKAVFTAIEPLTAEDLMRTITIRGQEHTVIQAINRQLSHYSSHIGQIVFLAKLFKSSQWTTLSVPKNRSAEFNAYLDEKLKSGVDTPRSDRLDEAIKFAASKSKP